MRNKTGEIIQQKMGEGYRQKFKEWIMKICEDD